ncbi:MAG TPA: polyphosphate:AMP phosphotransferase [Lachnospiraceae bacterium]|nr:polyphosphate:AMP phosphotransferase [Lachnospiraceae bacterium]
MLERIDLGIEIDKKEYKDKIKHLSTKLSALQRVCKESGIPIVILFEGFGASGKGTMINNLIQPLDPRGFKVYTIQRPTKEEKYRPFLWRFFTKLPANGRIALFDRSWYRRVLNDRLDEVTTPCELKFAYDEITNFEKLLIDDGMVIIKFFLHITRKEQKERFEKLLLKKETAWCVTKRDRKQNEHYDEYLKINNEMLERTDTSYAPWTIVEAMDLDYAAIKVMQTVVDRLEREIKVRKDKGLNNNDNERPDTENVKGKDSKEEIFQSGVLRGVDLAKDITKEEYKKKLKYLQERLSLLHSDMYRRRIPVVIAFEGWDAAGKGGAIKRLTQVLDPRGYEVIPISAPNDVEREHHYLWRFWNTVPKAGHLAIYDRTWYGRVLVERVEGFCTEAEWKRAYHEINKMEEHLTNAGTIVIKFWLHIDKDEQEKRFLERQNNPEKAWKITDEDWRNRAKWDQYEEAVDEMLIKTSTTYAPWSVVEANSKMYARIKILETVVNAIENRLE